MTLEWESPSNALLLNPRLRVEVRLRFESAWQRFIERDFAAHVGIATSGSSGDALGKLIVLGKSAILANAAAVNRHFHSGASDVWLKTLPSFHVGGIGIYARAFLSGAKVVESRMERWEPRGFHSELTESRASLLSLVPTQLFDLVQLGLRAPANLRAVIIGGGRLEGGLRERAQELGWPVYASYGCTECCSQVATVKVAGSEDLVPLEHVEIRIEPSGRIALKSAALLTGQITVQERGEFFGDPKQDDWFVTEDRGVLEHGVLRVLGRETDFVKIGGEGVVMSRLEDRLEGLRAAAGGKFEAIVLAAADERLGAKVVMLTTADELTSQILMALFNEASLPFERIRSIHRLKAMPRSPLGKILRAEAFALVGLKSAAHF